MVNQVLELQVGALQILQIGYRLNLKEGFIILQKVIVKVDFGWLEAKELMEVASF